jgi:sugar O-acyltransferase (sialic acid O-acetyltransferase NeuD family)
MRDIAILGAGGQAREVAFLIDEINQGEVRWRIVGFVDKDEKIPGSTVGKYQVLCAQGQVDQIDCALAAGIGEPRALRSIYDRFSGQLEGRFPNLIHPSVVMDRSSVRMGYGNVLCAGSVLTTDIVLGSVNIINSNCTIGHDVTIGNGCVLNPSTNVSGNVTVEDGCLIGTGAQILQGLTIGANAQVGAGAVVTENVGAGSTVVGVPARPLER